MKKKLSYNYICPKIKRITHKLSKKKKMPVELIKSLKPVRTTDFKL